MKKTMVTLLMTMFSLNAWSHYRETNCLIDDYIFMSSDTDYSQACVTEKAPVIETTTRSYPLLKGNPYDVRYWSAKVVKPVITTKHYTRYITNRCTHEQVFSGPYDVKETAKIGFILQNPNLSDDVKASYELAPMTDLEAQVAFQNLLQTCQNYSN